MKILALEKETPGVTDEQMRPHLKAEALRVWELYQLGVFREMYFNAETHSAVLLLECDNLTEARAALETLPLVQAKLIAFELMPLIPYSGFSRLFFPTPD